MQLGIPTSGSMEELLQGIQHDVSLGSQLLSQLASHRRSWDRHSPLQESQLPSFLASDGAMLYEVYIFICKERLVIPESLHYLLILLLIGRSKNNSIEF